MQGASKQGAHSAFGPSTAIAITNYLMQRPRPPNTSAIVQSGRCKYAAPGGVTLSVDVELREGYCRLAVAARRIHLQQRGPLLAGCWIDQRRAQEPCGQLKFGEWLYCVLTLRIARRHAANHGVDKLMVAPAKLLVG